jgi:hypothetical protein
MGQILIETKCRRKLKRSNEKLPKDTV